MRRFALLLALAAYPAFAKPVEVDATRLVTVLGPVTRNITAEARKLLLFSDPNAAEKKPIWVLVNSPGGSVHAGMLFINAMKTAKNRGYRVNCVSGKLAASMGFHILINCSEVIATPHALLLFHAPFLSGLQKLDKTLAIYLAVELKRLEEKFITEILAATKLPRREMLYHFRNETFWTAERLSEKTKMVQVSEDIRGIDELLYSRGNPMEPAWRQPRTNPTDIVYIHPRVQEHFLD